MECGDGRFLWYTSFGEMGGDAWAADIEGSRGAVLDGEAGHFGVWLGDSGISFSMGGIRLMSPNVDRIDGRLWPRPSDLGESICNGGSSPLAGDNAGGGD